MTILYTHPASLAHDTGDGHPERPARIRAIAGALAAPAFADLDRRAAPMAALEEVLRCHPAAHVARLEGLVPDRGLAMADADTILSPGSWEAALRAVGGAVAAVDAVLDGPDRTAFVAMRPPGHHAERTRAMGFCLFSTAAIAAKHALDARGLGRVAVLDFDVHHGNGTQDCLLDEGRAIFVSSHQMPLYPGTGAADEVGAHGQIVNLPLTPGSDGAAMRAAWSRALARVRDFRPDLILVSAGFDAHRDDPLGGLNWTEADYGWITAQIRDLADGVCEGRVVSLLEGGYDLGALAASVAVHVAGLQGGAG